MKVALCTYMLFFGVRAWADESGDRVAIGRAIAGLNELLPRRDLFTSDSDSISQLERLRKGKHSIEQYPCLITSDIGLK